MITWTECHSGRPAHSTATFVCRSDEWTEPPAGARWHERKKGTKRVKKVPIFCHFFVSFHKYALGALGSELLYIKAKWNGSEYFLNFLGNLIEVMKEI